MKSNITETLLLLVHLSLASRLNGYMYSNGKSLNVAHFILMANHLSFVSRVTLQLLGVKIIPCRVASLIDILLKLKDWGQSKSIYEVHRTQI